MTHKITANLEKLLTLEEAAEILLISTATLYGWVHQRKIPFRKHGSKLVFSYQEIMKWSARQSVPPSIDFGIESEGDDDMMPLLHYEESSLKTEKSRKSRPHKGE